MTRILKTCTVALLLIMMTGAFSLGNAAEGSNKPLKIYILAGQSNMQGQARVRTIERLNMSEDSKPMYKDLIGDDGKPVTVKDAYAVYFTSSKTGPTQYMGPLRPSYSEESTPEDKFGPEYTFGLYLQRQLNEPFLIIKTAWGGKDLIRQFRPPSAGELPMSASKVEKYKAEGTYEAELVKWKESTGEYYRLMMGHVQEVLKDVGKYHPAYNKEVGYEIAGFVWFQGFNDLVNGFYKDSGEPMEKMFAPYTDNMAAFIRDVRKDLNVPQMPFVIGVLGVDGPKDETNKLYWFRKAQAAPADMPEFKGNVMAVHTAECWDMEVHKINEKLANAAMEKVKKDNPEVASRPRAAEGLRHKYMKEFKATFLTPEELNLKTVGESNQSYHYNGSAYIMGKIGKAFAEAMWEMRK